MLLNKGIYKLQFHCGTSYLGQTGQLHEYRRDAELGHIERSAVAEHLQQNGQCNIKFDEAMVLGTHYYPCVIRESITENNEKNPNNFQLSKPWKLN